MKRTRGTWLLCATLAAGCASSTTNPGGDARPPTGDYQPARTEAGQSFDFAVPKPGTNCKPEHTSAIYTSAEEKAAWFPRVNWANDRYGVMFFQRFYIKDDYQEREKVGFIALDRQGQKMAGPTWVTDEPTGYNIGPGAIMGLDKGFGVLWSDSRANFKEFKRDIYYQRVDENGARVGTAAPITSSQAASYPSVDAPAFIAIEGPRQVKELGVVWSDSRNLKSVPYPPYEEGRRDLYFKKIGVDGKELMAEKRITTDQSEEQAVWTSLAYDGSGYALAWDNSQTGYNQRFLLLLDLDGTPRSAEKELGKDYGLLSSAPDLVATDQEYGIVYSENQSKDNGRIRFSRIDKRGEMMAAQQATALGNPCTPAIAFNGERYAVVWQSNCGQDGSALMFALLDDGGHPLGSDGKSCFGNSDPNCGLITVSPPSEGVAAFPDMVGVAGRFAVTWMNAPEKTIYFSHVTCSPN